MNTPEMELRIERAFCAKYGKVGDVNVDFEHGQWWVTEILTGAQWSVVDVEGPNTSDGFDFEQVSLGEEDCSQYRENENQPWRKIRCW